MQPKRIAQAGLALVLLLAAGLIAWRMWVTRYDAPVSFNPFPNDTVEGQNVVTTLHEYIRGSDTTTGRSISFSFPANYYGYADNVEGGPQYRIKLRLHRKTWQPIIPDEEVAIWSIPPLKNLRDVLGELRSNDLSINIFSKTKSISSVLQSIAAVRAYNAGIKPIAEGCDLFLFERDRIEDSLLEGNMPLDDLINSARIGLVGISADSVSEQALTAISCTASSPTCIVQAPFEKWTKSFAIKRAELCEWRTVARQIDDLLATHVVARTPPRQPD